MSTNKVPFKIPGAPAEKKPFGISQRAKPVTTKVRPNYSGRSAAQEDEEDDEDLTESLGDLKGKSKAPSSDAHITRLLSEMNLRQGNSEKASKDISEAMSAILASIERRDSMIEQQLSIIASQGELLLKVTDALDSIVSKVEYLEAFRAVDESIESFSGIVIIGEGNKDEKRHYKSVADLFNGTIAQSSEEEEATPPSPS